MTIATQMSHVFSPKRLGSYVTKIGLVLGMIVAATSGADAEDFPPLPEWHRSGYDSMPAHRRYHDDSSAPSRNRRGYYSRYNDTYENDVRPERHRGRDPDSTDWREPERPRYQIDERDDNYDRRRLTPTSDYREEKEPSELDQIRTRLSQRYRNPTTIRFSQGLSFDRAMSVYREISQIIDTRHLSPKSYQERLRQGVKNLVLAVEDADFLQANRVSASREQIRQFQTALVRLEQNRKVRNYEEAVSFIRSAASLASQTVGLNSGPVAVEFVHAAAEVQDKYSAFEPKASQQQPSASLDEQVVGIGVEIKTHEDGVRVIRALRGGPAAQAGLKKNDLIVAVNGRQLAGKSLDYAADLIGGSAGSRVQLSIVRDGRRPTTVTLTRRQVRIYSVSEVHMVDRESGIGYIRLDQFSASSEEEMDQALWQLYREGMKSLVIDLRGNPGGLLTTAVSLSNKFLPCGTIVSTRGRTQSDNSSETARREQTWRIPLAVLVDENSASASEIFAAAIQENERGIVVGRKTYGKGTVQTHFPLRSASGNLRLTTANFYSPNGRVMAGEGVEPDVYVQGEWTAEDGYSPNDPDLQEAVQVARDPQLKEMADNSLNNCKVPSLDILSPRR